MDYEVKIAVCNMYLRNCYNTQKLICHKVNPGECTSDITISSKTERHRVFKIYNSSLYNYHCFLHLWFKWMEE